MLNHFLTRLLDHDSCENHTNKEEEQQQQGEEEEQKQGEEEEEHGRPGQAKKELREVESGGHLARLAAAAAAAAIPHCSPSSGPAGQGEQSCRPAPAGQPPTNGYRSVPVLHLYSMHLVLSARARARARVRDGQGQTAR